MAVLLLHGAIFPLFISAAAPMAFLSEALFSHSLSCRWTASAARGTAWEPGVVYVNYNARGSRKVHGWATEAGLQYVPPTRPHAAVSNKMLVRFSDAPLLPETFSKPLVVLSLMRPSC